MTVNLKMPPVHIDVSSALLSHLVFTVLGYMCVRQRRAVNWMMLLQRKQGAEHLRLRKWSS